MGKVTYKALLIGNSIFDEDDTLTNLKGPPNDVNGMEQVLSHPQVGLHDEDNITTVLEGTRRDITLAAERFFADASKDDQLLFYYSGHGWLDESDNIYLCARDTVSNSLEATAVRDSSINTMINHSPSSRVVIILDCCHSGRFKGAGIPSNLEGTGRFVIASSRSKELAEDSTDPKGKSTFTRCLLEAIMSSEIDQNKDGLISIDELVSSVNQRLRETSKSVAQRRYDRASGDLALARSIPVKLDGDKFEDEADQKPVSVRRPERPPSLEVSETKFEIRDVMPGEELAEEVVDVFNLGGGTLHWTVECDDDWIEIEKRDRCFRMKLNPKPGTNRGRVYVRDEGGSSKRIQVMVHVLPEKKPPKLELSEEKVDLGTIARSASPPSHSVRVINAGGGELNARIRSLDRKIEARLIGDILEITPDTREAGKIEGEIVVESDGGTANIHVAATIEIGPVLDLSESHVDFGEITENKCKEITVNVFNSGSGDLEWDYEAHGDFFRALRVENRLKLELDAQPGRYHGTVIVKSNGGDKTIDIRGAVKARPVEPPRPQKEKKLPEEPAHAQIAGTWGIPGLGSLHFIGVGPNYQYQEFNMMGVVCGEGSATVAGNNVTLSGQNIVSGPVEGRLSVVGNNMNGVLVGSQKHKAPSFLLFHINQILDMKMRKPLARVFLAIREYHNGRIGALLLGLLDRTPNRIQKRCGSPREIGFFREFGNFLDILIFIHNIKIMSKQHQ